MTQQFVIIIENLRQSQRDPKQASALGRELQPRRIRPLTITASSANAGSVRWYAERNASKLQRGPLWDSATPSTSNGMAPVLCASEITSLGRTKTNSGSLSINRAMSQGHATLSIFGRSRVIHFIVRSVAAVAVGGRQLHMPSQQAWLCIRKDPAE